mmetsp:Transcript_12865/g.25888  ORF Transcript_12865/g.25888 Transcript_12865/m.25888 type:complete len:256 (+) Transcript_12865:2933-3700(+)
MKRDDCTMYVLALLYNRNKPSIPESIFVIIRPKISAVRMSKTLTVWRMKPIIHCQMPILSTIACNFMEPRRRKVQDVTFLYSTVCSSGIQKVWITLLEHIRIIQHVWFDFAKVVWIFDSFVNYSFSFISKCLINFLIVISTIIIIIIHFRINNIIHRLLQFHFRLLQQLIRTLHSLFHSLFRLLQQLLCILLPLCRPRRHVRFQISSMCRSFFPLIINPSIWMHFYQLVVATSIHPFGVMWAIQSKTLCTLDYNI